MHFLATTPSSVSSLFDCCIQICQHLPSVSIVELNDALVSAGEGRKVDEELVNKKRLNSITVKLQQNEVITAQARKLFKIIVRNTPATNARLDANDTNKRIVEYES